MTSKEIKITQVTLGSPLRDSFGTQITYTYTTALEAKDAMEKAFAAKGDAQVDVFAGATKLNRMD